LSCFDDSQQLVAKGTYGNVNNAEFHSRLENLQPTHLASLVFTSGTTGLAKCAMLSHRNLMFSACAIGRLLAIEESDSLLSFLPFSHIAEQLLAIYVPIVARCRIYFAESTAKLHRNMRETQPTLVFAPPELWRKIYLAVQVRVYHSSLVQAPSSRSTNRSFTPLHPQSKVPTSAAQTMNAPALSALWTAMGFARVRYAACAYGHLPEVTPARFSLFLCTSLN
jgi:long-chain acyl-CoA synthetase